MPSIYPSVSLLDLGRLSITILYEWSIHSFICASVILPLRFTPFQCCLLKCQAGLTSVCSSLSWMASSGSHFRVIPRLSSDRSSRANIFPATLKTRAVSLKGKPSVTPGLAMQYSRISSMFIGNEMNPQGTILRKL
jgi:hypothetical protein